MLVKQIAVGPFQCNCRVYVCPQTLEAALVDPGDEPEKILKMLDQAAAELGRPIQLKFLFHTHAHLDHIGATRGVKEALLSQAAAQGASVVPEIFLHKGDLKIYENLVMQGQMFGLSYDAPLPVDRFLEDGETLTVGKSRFEVIHTPGHSPGSVCLRVHEDRALGVEEQVLSGDTLFQMSIGRTDLWEGDHDLLLKSIRNRLFTLDDDTVVKPGHGPDSRVGIEKRENPFF